MLILSRQVGERVRIEVAAAELHALAESGEPLVLFVEPVRVRGDNVRLGLSGPREAVFLREEVHQRMQAEAAAA